MPRKPPTQPPEKGKNKKPSLKVKSNKTQTRKRKPSLKATSSGNVVDFLAFKEKRETTLTQKKETNKRQEVIFVSTDANFPKVPTVFRLHKDYILGKQQEVEIVMLPYGSDIDEFLANESE